MYFLSSVLRSKELQVFYDCLKSFIDIERFKEFRDKWFVQKYKEGCDNENDEGHVEDGSWNLGVTFLLDKVSLELRVSPRVVIVANINGNIPLRAVCAVQRIAERHRRWKE